MCLCKKHTFPKFAFKNITVFKRLMRYCNCYYTPYYSCLIKIGKTYSSSENIFKGIFKKYIEGEGIHSYCTFNKSKSFKRSNEIIVECIIPRGSWYYIGDDGTLASNKLKYVKIIN